jgi:hypothetical protein
MVWLRLFRTCADNSSSSILQVYAGVEAVGRIVKISQSDHWRLMGTVMGTACLGDAQIQANKLVKKTAAGLPETTDRTEKRAAKTCHLDVQASTVAAGVLLQASSVDADAAFFVTRIGDTEMRAALAFT